MVAVSSDNQQLDDVQTYLLMFQEMEEVSGQKKVNNIFAYMLEGSCEDERDPLRVNTHLLHTQRRKRH